MKTTNKLHGRSTGRRNDTARKEVVDAATALAPVLIAEPTAPAAKLAAAAWPETVADKKAAKAAERRAQRVINAMAYCPSLAGALADEVKIAMCQRFPGPKKKVHYIKTPPAAFPGGWVRRGSRQVFVTRGYKSSPARKPRAFKRFTLNPLTAVAWATSSYEYMPKSGSYKNKFPDNGLPRSVGSMSGGLIGRLITAGSTGNVRKGKGGGRSSI